MDTKSQTSEMDDRHQVPLWWLILAGAGVAVLWGLSAWLIVTFADADAGADKVKTLLGNRGTFGDMFGAVNSLFSGLAFAALIYTVAQQRTELRFTREEMMQQSREWERQNAVLSLQAFEGSFFQMLRMLDDAANAVFASDVTLNENGIAVLPTGGPAFKILLSEISQDRGFLLASCSYAEATELKVVRDTMSRIVRIHGVGFFRYQEALTNVAAFVYRSEVEDKEFYTRLLRSQMSNDQLSFVFYLSFGQDADHPLRSSLDRIHFVDSIPVELLILPEHKDIYYNLDLPD